MNSIEFARQLRKSQSDAEHRFWLHVRNRRLAGYKFRRQRPVGPYVVDFICESARVIVELDGGQHADQRRYDDNRDRYLRDRGYSVLRFWNNDVLQNMDGVLEAALRKLSDRALTRAARDLSQGER